MIHEMEYTFQAQLLYSGSGRKNYMQINFFERNIYRVLNGSLIIDNKPKYLIQKY
jgi:hypothetical protein